MDCLFGRFLRVYILLAKSDDLVVEAISKPWTFFLGLIGEGDEMLIVFRPLNWGRDEFFFITIELFLNFLMYFENGINSFADLIDNSRSFLVHI